jgi:hypothetical protein
MNLEKHKEFLEGEKQKGLLIEKEANNTKIIKYNNKELSYKYKNENL